MKYRVVNRFRFISFLLICLLILSLIIVPLFNTSFARSKESKSYVQITVNPGDTLWQIAREYGPGNKDVREVIYDICKLNGISAETLKAGDMLLIPSK